MCAAVCMAHVILLCQISENRGWTTNLITSPNTLLQVIYSTDINTFGDVAAPSFYSDNITIIHVACKYM